MITCIVFVEYKIILFQVKSFYQDSKVSALL